MDRLTVKEVIKLLQKCNQNKELIYIDEGNVVYVTTIEEHDDDVSIY